MRFLRQSLMGLFLTAVTLGLLAYAAQMVRGAVQARMAEEPRAQTARERIFAVGVVTAELGRQTPVLQAFGEVRAERTLELRAAAAGRIIEKAPGFVEGGVVQTGDVLLRVDPADAQAARDRMQADLQDAEAEVRDAEAALILARDDLAAARDQEALRAKALTRQQDLGARGVGTAAAVETAELAVAAAAQSVLSKRQAVTQAQARISQSATRLRRAEIALSEAERKLADTVVVAPFDGTLSEVTLTLGRLVSNTEKLATLIDPQALEVAFRLSTVQYARLLGDAGQLTALPIEAALDVSGIDLTARGRVQRDSAAVGDAQSGRVIFASLENAAGFKPGDFVTVRVDEPAIERVVRLPAAALDGSGTVLVLGEEDRLEALDVTLLRRQGNDVLVRGAGLEGREVVTARTPLLGAGIAVRPLRRDAQQAPQAPSMVDLTDAKRAELIAFVQANTRMPTAVKERILSRLGSGEKVPAQLVDRLQSRMGG
ncbi:MAG: efflux RND transporter periplasmic adaptor subunit [Paracoccaceae bacterium]